MARYSAGGAGIGALLAYFFDPSQGRRRRALLRDQVVHVRHEAEHAAQSTFEDLNNRITGLFAEVRDRSSARPVDDNVLSERVRARVGRLVCHPGAIYASAVNGQVTLTGPVLRDEVARLLAGVRAVPGVRGIDNRLGVHDEPGDVPGLQGECNSALEQAGFFERGWSPAIRLLAGVGGISLALFGVQRRGALGTGLAIVGGALALQGITNWSVPALIGLIPNRRGIFVQKTINVEAPIDEVYRFLSEPQNFPSFMSHVDQVLPVAPNRYCWTVKGPAGIPVSFETVVTQAVPNRFIIWQSVPGSAVLQTGFIRFEMNRDGSTRVGLKLRYDPPGGELGNLVAELFGADPRQALNDDMLLFKSLLENGRTTAHGRTVSVNEVAGREQAS
jgi:uncharacterized membrane protein